MALSNRTHTCGELRLDQVGERVILQGWVQSRRDLGSLIFLALRDRYGLTQVALDTSANPALVAAGHELKPEYVVAVAGSVRPRPEEARNPAMATGDIEIAADALEILNSSLTPPFEILDELKISDEIRMRYRYLDLRRNRMKENLILRHRFLLALRCALSERGFLEIETPFLTRSTPEGARDYLVPSRVHPGKFYALPQSPQLFKQLLMVGGMDRYFQIVRCMRDEDLRADRQPEFTQLDVEMSFADEEVVFGILESVLAEVMKRSGLGSLPVPFPRILHAEAMKRFGSDKPDLRFGMELFDLGKIARTCDFQVFKSAVESGGAVLGITAPGYGGCSRKEIDSLTQFVVERGAKGLAWFKIKEGELTSPIAKFFSLELQQKIREEAGAAEGDLVLIVAGPLRMARLALGELRVEMAARCRLPREGLAFCWVTEFPMFEVDEQTGALVPSHHPFTTPREEYEGHLEKDPANLKARAYDLVLNGIELGSGSIRIHRRELQARIFKALGIGDEEAREKFGFLLEAFEYGAPPHAGIALGMDRTVMLLAGEGNIREVIAFPKTATGSCPLTGAPAEVDDSVLEDLKIVVKKGK